MSPKPVPVFVKRASGAVRVVSMSTFSMAKTTHEKRYTQKNSMINVEMDEAFSALTGVFLIITGFIALGWILLYTPLPASLSITITRMALSPPLVEFPQPPIIIITMSMSWHAEGHAFISVSTVKPDVEPKDTTSSKALTKASAGLS